MTERSMHLSEEPVIAVGLLDRSESVRIQLEGDYQDSSGQAVQAGELQAHGQDGIVNCAGTWSKAGAQLELTPADVDACQFNLEATIGIDFHWQQQETQTFRGGLRLVAQPDDRIAVVNRVGLETYLNSVVCSEMKASSPPDFIKAHAVISRSWLLAQLEASRMPRRKPQARVKSAGEHIDWTDREAHQEFDVCADDHCQRYQGIARIDAPGVVAAIRDTRGELLTYDGHACDARFSKCCGGVVEEFQTAWADEEVPYLVARLDSAGSRREPPPLFEETDMRAFLEQPPAAYCGGADKSILDRVLNDYDLSTSDFFRWQIRLSATDAGRLVRQKLGVELGRLVDLQPIERGPSGRLKRLRLVGEQGALVIGKELEIRRALSESHLFSSAFVIDLEGPAARPDAFRLTGAGWGHGVGLCQIGAAVMACQGQGYCEILEHYYPGARVERVYG